MPAYMVVTRERTRNAAKIDEYRTTVRPTVEPYGGKILAAGGPQEVFEGPANEELILLEFPTYEAAKQWYHSAAYQAAAQIRYQGGDYRFILTDGRH